MMAFTIAYQSLLHQVPGVRILTCVFIPTRCAKHRMYWSGPSNRESYEILAPSSNGRNKLLLGYRGASSLPPMLDPDTERLQRSLKGLDRSRPSKYDGDRLIYEVRAANYIKVVMLAFYGTALAGLYMAPDFVVGAWESDAVSADMVMNLVMLLSGVVVLPTVMTLLSRRLVLKMYHNEARDTYIAVVSKLILGLGRNRFQGEDVISIPENTFQRAFRLTSFKVNGRPYFVNSSHFKSPSDYNKLMHYN